MIDGLMLMGFGMGGIFIVLAVLYLSIKLLNKLCATPKKETEKGA